MSKQGKVFKIEWDDEGCKMMPVHIKAAIKEFCEVDFRNVTVTELPPVEGKMDVVQYLGACSSCVIEQYRICQSVLRDKIQPIIDTLQLRAEEAERKLNIDIVETFQILSIDDIYDMHDPKSIKIFKRDVSVKSCGYIMFSEDIDNILRSIQGIINGESKGEAK